MRLLAFGLESFSGLTSFASAFLGCFLGVCCCVYLSILASPAFSSSSVGSGFTSRKSSDMALACAPYDPAAISWSSVSSNSDPIASRVPLAAPRVNCATAAAPSIISTRLEIVCALLVLGPCFMY